MKKFYNFELKIILLLILTFIILRSLYFSENLNFSADQGLFSLKALELWQQKELTLVGPPTSFIYEGRAIFQGSITYYMQLVFLLLGNWNPIAASYIFMLFCAVMVIPLYYGTKFLSNSKSALLITIIYTALPFYIEYTRFLWNPTFQLSITPLLILFLGLWKKTKHTRYLFLSGTTSGLLVLFHYQFVIALFALSCVFLYKSIKNKDYEPISFFIIGVILGASPFWISELKTNFYNLSTAYYLFSHRTELSQDRTSILAPHYFLSLTLLCLVVITSFTKKIVSTKVVVITTLLLISLSFLNSIQKPSNGDGMIKNWNYTYEEKAYRIIRSQNLQNYNVVNLGYETIASVQKYLHAKDNQTFNFNNYSTNQYLFIITNKENYLDDPAYEISSFQNPKIINTWILNNSFNLILIERI